MPDAPPPLTPAEQWRKTVTDALGQAIRARARLAGDSELGRELLRIAAGFEAMVLNGRANGVQGESEP